MSQDQASYNLDVIKRENTALRKYSAIQKATEDKIGVQKIYVDITRDIEAALVLDEIIFFTLPRDKGPSGLRIWKDGVLWLAVQRADWWERKRLTPRQADTAIQKLSSQSLVIKKIYKFNGQTTTHLRLNVGEFFRRYMEELEKENPPENPDDTILRDITDLYEMMGVNRELQNGDSRIRESPNGETELQNGDSINIPHQPSINDVNDRTALLAKLYAENIGLITPLIADSLQDAAVDYPEESWYVPAFKVAVANNARNWTYVDRVLGNWKKHGLGWKPERANGHRKSKPASAGKSTLTPEQIEEAARDARLQLLGE